MLSEVSAEAIAQYMASFLLDHGGSNILERTKEKIKSQNFKKREKVFFEYHFRDVKDANELQILLDFLDGMVVLDNRWYSNEDKISAAQQDSLWRAFGDYKKRRSGDSYAPIEYKEKLVYCANFHNKLVNELIVNDSAHFVISALQNNQKRVDELMNKKAIPLNESAALHDTDDMSHLHITSWRSVPRLAVIINWVIRTIFVGASPLVIKFIICLIHDKPLIFDDYCTEIFFLTSIFLIDAARNFSASGHALLMGIVQFVLVVSAAVYGSFLTNQIEASALALNISSTNTFQSLTISLLASSSLLDIISTIVSRRIET